MTDIIFCDTDFHLKGGYVSYDDFFRLVKLSGYPIIPLSQLDPDDASKCYIFSPANGETAQGWPGAKARIILYQLEWNLDGSHSPPPGVAEVWTMDAAYASQIGAKYVPIGSHPDLKLPIAFTSNSAKYYDGCFLAYMVPRRQQIAHELMQLGIHLAPHNPGNGFDRHKVLMETRAMLHIHQHGHVRGVACLRWAIAAAYSLPVISEQVDDKGIFGHTQMLTSDFRNYARFAQMWLHQNEARILEDFGRALHQLLCVDKTFKHMVEANV